MLEDCLIDSRSSARSKKPATMILSVIVHGSLLSALILIPLFQIPLLPQVTTFLPLAPPSAAPRSVELVPVGPAARASSAPVTQPTVLTVPPKTPDTIVRVFDAPTGGVVGLLPGTGNAGGGFPGGVDFGVGGLGREVAPPTPPPAPPPAPPSPPVVERPTAPVRVGTLEPSMLVHSVKPEYPRLAVITRVQGPVILEAVVTREGKVDAKRLKVISGHPLLTPAAVEAVAQWRYRPTILNGEAIEVLATITVNFTLN